MRNSLYHSLLRISSLTVALVLLFESGLVNPITKELSQQTHEYLSAAVGVGASIEPTELNQMTAKLSLLENDLKNREAALEKREIAVNLNTESGSTNDSDLAIYILSFILFILLLLIILNYVLDFLRRNPIPRSTHEQTT